jgi:hypothetical protein
MKSLHEKKVHMERDDPVEGPRTFVQPQANATVSNGSITVTGGNIAAENICSPLK